MLIPALRGILISAIIILVGVPPTLKVAVYPLAGTHGLSTARADRAALMLISVSLLAIVVAVSGLTYLKTSEAIPLSMAAIRRFLGTDRGFAWLTETAIVPIVGGVTVLRFPRHPRISRREWLTAVTLGGLFILAIVSWQGHSTAIESEIIAIAVKFVHMTGAALWTGGLVVLAVIAPRVLTEAREETTEASGGETSSETVAATPVAIGMIRRFSIVAVAGVTLAAASGFAITAWHVKSVASLTSTFYGLGLITKVALVLVAAGLGGFTRAIVVRRLTRDSENEQGSIARMIWCLPLLQSHDPTKNGVVSVFVRAVRLELIVLISVIFLSVFLTASLSPPVDPSDQSMESEAPIGVGDGTIDVWLTHHGGSFTFLIELTALGVALAGILAVSYELLQSRSQETT